jgi:hypothetical protein
MRVPAAGLSIRRIGPEDGASLNALAETDNLFDEDPAVGAAGGLKPHPPTGIK